MGIQTSDLSLNERVEKNLADVFMRASIARAQDLLGQKRADAFEELGDYEIWRENAATARSHVLKNLDVYLSRFADRAAENGAGVFFARTGREAADHALEIFGEIGAKKIVKSKSMVTEEINLNESLEAAGLEVVETDLGEYILQTDDYDKPSHIVVPALHKDREAIRKIFAEKKGYAGDNQPEHIAAFVRKEIRKDFLTADAGVTGCNFGVAESGTVTLVTNEGNGRFVSTAPETQIVFMGMERVAASFADLDILLTLLIRSAVGARLTSYLSLATGPARENETDGPKRLEIIIVDNGRSDVLAGPFREVLRCVRCGTCMLACPVYRQIGGHGYGTLYPGPLGLALAPAMAGHEACHDIVRLCSLCGACDDVCPVKIPLYRLILAHRRVIAEEKKLSGKGEALAMGLFGRLFANPALYDAAARRARLGRFLPEIGPLKNWTRDRELPRFPEQSFRAWMEKRSPKGGRP